MAVPELTLGPILFNWPPGKWRDFYFRVADEACFDTVYIGEVVCAKRAPLFESLYEEITPRLRRAGKRVVLSTLAEVMVDRERRLVDSVCRNEGATVEANDAGALYHLRGRPHYVGPYVNTYNENTLAFLAAGGAVRVTLPYELTGEALHVLSTHAAALNVALEVPVYGRIPLALSARCYHARAHGRVKDNCQYVCEQDPDGMALETLQGQPFLSINGVQTLSHSCLNLVQEVPRIGRVGVSALRLSPHSRGTVEAAELFRNVLDDRMDPAEAVTALQGIEWERGAGERGVPFSNGFYHGRPGYEWVETEVDGGR